MQQSHNKWAEQLEAFLTVPFPRTERAEAVNKNTKSEARFSPEVSQRLAAFFADDVKRLSALLKVDLNSYWDIHTVE